ncbi:hypothetical protein DFAR_2730010 [Desulfarculales bacterium]
MDEAPPGEQPPMGITPATAAQ